jgi:hypothetical protein
MEVILILGKNDNVALYSAKPETSTWTFKTARQNILNYFLNLVYQIIRTLDSIYFDIGNWKKQ